MPPEMARMISRPLRMRGESDIRTILTPLRGYSCRMVCTHGLRHGLSSYAPPGLRWGEPHPTNPIRVPKLFRAADAGFFVVQGDFVLQDFLDHHFQIGEII